MSKHESELRRRVALQHDLYETITWFIAVNDLQAYADGKPAPADLLSEWEREYLADNIERFHQARIERMPFNELITRMVLGKPAPGAVLIDMSAMPDRKLLDATIGADGDSACAELLKRANAKRLTVADFIKDVLLGAPRAV
jgi:hypothetical protein